MYMPGCTHCSHFVLELCRRLRLGKRLNSTPGTHHDLVGPYSIGTCLIETNNLSHFVRRCATIAMLMSVDTISPRAAASDFLGLSTVSESINFRLSFKQNLKFLKTDVQGHGGGQSESLHFLMIFPSRRLLTAKLGIQML